MQYCLRHVLLLLSLFAIYPLYALEPELPEDPKVRIGVIAPLSGNVAQFGTAIVNGMLLAVEDEAEKLRRVEFAFEDDQYDPKQSISSFRKLLAKDVSLVFVSGVAPGEAVAPLAEQAEMPTMLNCQAPQPARDRRFVFRFINSTGEFVDSLWSHFRSRGWKTVALIETEAPYIQAYSRELHAQRQGEEEVISLGTVAPNVVDFRSLLLRVKAMNVDAVGVLLFPGQIRSYYRQAAELRVSMPTFGTDLFESEEELEAAGPGIEGAVFSANPIDPLFTKKYRERFGDTEQLSAAANGYDFVKFVASLEERRIHWDDAEALRTAIRSVPPPPLGALGQAIFSDTSEKGQQFAFPLTVKVVEHQTFRNYHAR